MKLYQAKINLDTLRNVVMLKLLLPIVAVAGLFTQTATATEFVNKDGSKLTNICIDAVESKLSFASLSRADLYSVTCNGTPIKQFVKQYRAKPAIKSDKVVSVLGGNNSIETQLCVAAAKSNEAFELTLARLDPGFNVSNLYCNGRKLAKFAKKYNRTFEG